MKNIQKRGEGYRAQVYSTGLRLCKTFRVVEEAQAWVAERKAEARKEGRFINVPDNPKRRRVNHMALFFPRRSFPELLTEAEIVGAAVPRPQICGIYFLVVGGKVMYVGQSMDVHARIKAHVGRKFDAFHFVPCAESELNHLESRYILALAPPWNRGKDGQLILSIYRDAPGLRAVG